MIRLSAMVRLAALWRRSSRWALLRPTWRSKSWRGKIRPRSRLGKSRDNTTASITGHGNIGILNENNLPPGTTILFKKPTIWDEYRGTVLARILIVGLQTAICWCIVDSATQKAARRKPAQG